MTREDEGDFHLRISYAEAFRVTGALGSPSRLDSNGLLKMAMEFPLRGKGKGTSTRMTEFFFFF